VLFAQPDAKAIGEEAGLLGGRLNAPVRHAANRRNSLRDDVDKFLGLVVERVEQLVELVELHSAHRPVRLFELRFEIEAIGQARLKQGGHPLTLLLREIELTGVH
jgi:hypothetical protein